MTPSSARNVFIDHVRVVLTMLVIFHHTAIEYGGSGGWYWREQANASNALLFMLNALNQSFFMGFFFLLAGYFTPAALARKGIGAFIKERMLRLGVPLLSYFFLLQPLTVALAHPEQGRNLWSAWLDMMRAGEFAPGPLWFVEALLIFSAGYLIWQWLRLSSDTVLQKLPGFGSLLLMALVLGLISFLVRLMLPVGHEFLWLQLGYFPCYIALFAMGCTSANKQLLDNISLRQAAPWMLVSLFSILGIPVLLFFLHALHAQGAFDGGWNLNAIVYALWDPLVAWGVILGMLWAARVYWGKATILMTWLARSAYGAFIVHPPILVAISVFASAWMAAPLMKFAVVGASAIMGSFICGGLLCRVPGVRRII